MSTMTASTKGTFYTSNIELHSFASAQKMAQHLDNLGLASDSAIEANEIAQSCGTKCQSISGFGMGEMIGFFWTQVKALFSKGELFDEIDESVLA